MEVSTKLFLDNGLSRRESEVAELVVRGFENQEIGDRLFVCTKTVRFHLTSIYKKTQLRDRYQFIVKFLTQLLVLQPDFIERFADGQKPKGQEVCLVAGKGFQER